MDIKVELWQALALAPVVTLLVLWLVRSLVRLPKDMLDYFRIVATWVRS